MVLLKSAAARFVSGFTDFRVSRYSTVYGHYRPWHYRFCHLLGCLVADEGTPHCGPLGRRN
ncbi:hypothetical protein SBV1_470004 [Verrucomicrobia bacterium]|nr:hypothetical protein SBV1_470004 [Verrucomicrobiota bacterium]